MPRPANKSKLARLRLGAGLSQRKLAAALGMHWRTISDWEQGRRGITDRHKRELAVALGVTTAEILAAISPP